MIYMKLKSPNKKIDGPEYQKHHWSGCVAFIFKFQPWCSLSFIPVLEKRDRVCCTLPTKTSHPIKLEMNNTIIVWLFCWWNSGEFVVVMPATHLGFLRLCWRLKVKRPSSICGRYEHLMEALETNETTSTLICTKYFNEVTLSCTGPGVNSADCKLHDIFYSKKLCSAATFFANHAHGVWLHLRSKKAYHPDRKLFSRWGYRW